MISSKSMHSSNSKCAADDGDQEEREELMTAAGSVFHVVLQSLKDLKEHMLYVIKGQIVQGICKLSGPYKREK